MNWAAGLYAAGLWVLVTAMWLSIRPHPQAGSHARLTLRVLREIVPGFLLGILIARLV